MNTPLSSFTALVKFKFDRAGLTTEIASVRRQLQGLTGSQERAARQREQSAARSFVSEMRMQRLQSRALRENEAFDLRRQAAQRTQERNREAQRLREQRLRDRDAAIQMRNMRQLADFQNREYDRTQRNRRRIEQQTQRDTNRLHTEALRENARRDAEAQRRLRQNRPSTNRGGGGSGGNANPWHIGTMAGGVGGLITRGNLAAVGAGAFTQQSFSQANFDVGQAPQFEFITGSAEKGAEQIAFVNKEVDRLSLNLFEANTMYRQLLASTKKNLGIEKTQELFSSFQNIATMLNLNTDAQARGMRAFAQMASKGAVMSEELNFRLAA